MTILNDILTIYDQLHPPLYYATHGAVTPGTVLCFNGDDFTPPYIICHPDNLDELRGRLPDQRWVHLRDYTPSTEDLARSLTAAAERLRTKETRV